MSAPAGRLTTGSIPAHIREIALPMSIGFFFNTMYNVVDSFFAGQISKSALAAMGLSFPVFFIILSVSSGISNGATALIANALGENDDEEVERLSEQVLSMAFYGSIILTIVGLLVMKPLFEAMGARGDYLDLNIAYMAPIFCGAIFFMFNSASNSILLAHGNSKWFSRVLIWGFFLNLILDPWFLYGGFGLPAMGIKGVALATVIIQAGSVWVLLAQAFKLGYVERAKVNIFVPDWVSYRKILKQGLPSMFNMMSIAVGFFIINYFLSNYGEAAVAAFGVGTRIEQLALLPSIGLSTAVVSIVGQNNGAGHLDRSQETVSKCIKYGLYLIVTASIGLWIFAEPLVRIFSDDAEVVKVGKNFVRIMAFIQWTYVMVFIHISYLQAIKRPMYGFYESIIRKITVPGIVFFIIVNIYSVSIDSFWISIAVINTVMAIVTISYVQYVLRHQQSNTTFKK